MSTLRESLALECAHIAIHSKLELIVVDLHNLARSLELTTLSHKRPFTLRITADSLSDIAKSLKHGRE